MRIFLSKPVRIRLEEIASYGENTWGIDQALVYARKLSEGILNLEAQKPAWRRYPSKMPKGVFSVRIESHLIFFQPTDEKLVVLTILHVNMNLLARLREDTRLAKGNDLIEV